MSRRSGRRRVDLFAVLLTVLTIGMSLTLAYQFSLYHGGASLPVARESQTGSIFGG